MRNRLVWGLVILALTCLSFPTFGAGHERGPAVEPQADAIVRQAARYLQNATQFTYHIEATMDEIPSSGPRLQSAHSVDIAVRRPDRLRVVTVDDADTRQSFWYDGKSFTLFNTKLNYYATADASPTIDATLDTMLERFGIIAPLADLVYNDPALPLLEGVESGRYVGLHRVHGERYHHLVFTQEDVDWQLWISAGKIPLPKKVVITYKRVEGSPQYTALLSGWNFEPNLDDAHFIFTAPEGAQQIGFLPVQNPVPSDTK